MLVAMMDPRSTWGENLRKGRGVNIFVSPVDIGIGMVQDIVLDLPVGIPRPCSAGNR